jgi:hypothetical protein
MSTPDDTLAAAARLEGSMRDLAAQLAALRHYGHRNRRMIWGLVVSIVLDVVLSVVVAVVAVQANNASSQAQQNRNAAITSCEAGNQARGVSVQLWTYVLDLSQKSPANAAPDKQKQIQDFRTYMTAAYAPRDCAQAGK